MTDRQVVRPTQGGDNEQVHDQGTETMSGSEVANAAAETLHGERAETEKYEQPDAVELPGGNTLIAKPEQPASEGKIDKRLN
jgi:hypothetical protein